MPKITEKTETKKEVKVVKTKNVEPVAKKETSTLNLTAQVFDVSGKKVGTQKLPDLTFAAKNNNQLLRQSLRVYETNKLTRNAHTKTRGEVRGGGAKPWKQKGTGNARAGSKRSPLWVGGGITFGPRSRKVTLTLPQKMRQIALTIALSQKQKTGNIHIISDLEKIEPKTKIIVNLLNKLELKGKTLIVLSQKNPNIKLASRNIQNVNIDQVASLNSYEIVGAANVIFSKEAMGVLK